MNQHFLTFSRILVLTGRDSVEQYLLMRAMEQRRWLCCGSVTEGTRKEGVSQRNDSRGRARELNNAAINAAALRC